MGVALGKLGTGDGQGFAPLFGAIPPLGLTHHPTVSLPPGHLAPTSLTAEPLTLRSDQQRDS